MCRVSDLYGKVTSSEDRDEETAQGEEIIIAITSGIIL